MTATIDRATSTDLMQLAVEVDATPMQVAVILVFEPHQAPDPAAVRAALDERIRAVPRLRQLLRPTPPGAGRPIWVDDPTFDIRRHLHATRCPAPGDETALLTIAAEVATTRLPPTRPLWAATLVTGHAPDRAALIIVIHHALADGVGGLEVLGRLVDGPVTPPAADFPSPPPSVRRVYGDALASRLRSIRGLPAAVRRVRDAIVELGARPTVRPSGYSLNRPTSPHRRLAVVRVPLPAVRDVAHAHGATINDVILTAVSGALGAISGRRGEPIRTVVISVMVSANPASRNNQLGNLVGAFPVALETTGDPTSRLETTARSTAAHKIAARGSSAALFAPAFRLLARLRLLRWFMNHQRLVTTFVTNLRGPAVRQTFLGASITDIIPISSSAGGNVTVAFAALSYAGTLAVTIAADPVTCPDLTDVADALRAELDMLMAAS